MENCKSIATHFNINSKKSILDKNPLTPKEEDMKNLSFQKDIGCLMHALACTALDISFVVGQVDKFQGMFPTCDIVIGQMLKAYLNI